MAHKRNQKFKNIQPHRVRSHNRIKISTKVFTNTWEINMLLINLGGKEEITRKIGKYFQLHKDGNKTNDRVCVFRCTNYTALILTK